MAKKNIDVGTQKENNIGYPEKKCPKCFVKLVERDGILECKNCGRLYEKDDPKIS